MKHMYALNPCYYFRQEGNRTYMLSKSFYAQSQAVNLEWRSIIHPVYAMILSFFSEPITKKDALIKIQCFLETTADQVDKLVDMFICNSKEIHSEYHGSISNFPKNVIIEVGDDYIPNHVYTPRDFMYKRVETNEVRPESAPFSLMIMFNNHCFTNCVYCYADKHTVCAQMDFNLVEKVLSEANKFGIATIGVLGGEFFLYPYWRKVLEEMKRYSYMPNLISTKVPLKVADIVEFRKYPIILQVSLDSVHQETLDDVVGHIANYATRMQESIRNVDKYSVERKFQMTTVLTKYNGTVKELDDLYDFVSQLQNLSRWEIRIGFKSLYSKSDFDAIKISRGQIAFVEKWIEEKRKKGKVKILWSKGQNPNFFQSKNGASSFVGARCSADYSHMVVLPNGDVTICEQLYWNPRFLIGNVEEQNISEIWNSPKALALANRKREDYSEQSACKKCQLQETCDGVQNKCFANILKAYGDEHWDYPDPRCCYAPHADEAISSYF